MEVAAWQMIAGSILLLVGFCVFGTWFTVHLARQKRRNDSKTTQPRRVPPESSSKGFE